MRVFYVRPSDNGNYCVEAALRSLPQPPEALDLALFRGSRVPLEPLNYDPAQRGFADLNAYDLVILAGLDPVVLTSQARLALIAFAERGGGLMLLGGSHSFGAAEGTYFPLAVLLPVEVQRGLDVEVDALPHATDHPIARGLPEPLGYIRKVHPVAVKPGGEVALTVADLPLVVVGEYGYGRVVVVASYPECEEAEYGWFFTGDAFDDFLRRAVAWVRKEQRAAWIGRFLLPDREVTTGSDQFGKVLLEATEPLEARLVTRLTRQGEAVHEDSARCHVATAHEAIFSFTVPRDPECDGVHYIAAALYDLEGRELDRSEAGLLVVNPTRLSLELAHGRRCLLPGQTARVRVHAFSERRVPPLQVAVTLALLDGQGASVVAFDEQMLSWAGSGYEEAEYEFEVPRLRPGAYRLRGELRAGGGLSDAAEEDVWVLAEQAVRTRFPLIAEGGYHLDRESIERGIGQLVEAGVNTLSFPGPVVTPWGERQHCEAMLTYTEEQALRAGLALAHHHHSLVPGLRATAPLEPCPLTPAFRPALDEQTVPILAAAAATPRLLFHEVVPQTAARWEQLCRCEACLAAYERSFGSPMPTDDGEALEPADLHALCSFVTSYWWHVYSVLRELRDETAPDLPLSLPFGAGSFLRAGRRAPYSDVHSWVRACEVVEVGHEADVATHRLSLSGHRALCQTLGTPFGALIDLAVEALPPAEAAFTALAHGASHLRVAANPRFLFRRRQPPLGEALGRLFARIAKAGPLLARSERPRARVALLYPFTQVVDRDGGGLLDAFELLTAAFGEIDFVHQRLAREEAIEEYDAVAILGTRMLPKKAARQLVAFVEHGGVLLADSEEMVDERGRPMGWPEHFFGTAETPVFENVTESRRAYGAGRTSLFSPDIAAIYRRTLAREDLLAARAVSRAVGEALAERGVRPRARADRPAVEVGLRACDGCQLLVAVNHGDQRETARVGVEADFACAFDLITGEEVPAEGRELSLSLAPRDGGAWVLYQERPFSVRLELSEARVETGDALQYRATVVNDAGQPVPGSHILRAFVTDPDGAERPDLGGERVTRRGVLEDELPLAVNERPGPWTLAVTDALTRRIVRRTFEVVAAAPREEGDGS
ncbi:MAG: glutamine amidotransferase [Planctomycetota bacterium]